MNDENTLPYGLPGAPGGIFGPAAGYEYLSSIIEDISDEAIKADMEHRHYRYEGDGVYRGGWNGVGLTIRWDGNRLEAGAVQGGAFGQDQEFVPDETENNLFQEHLDQQLQELASEVFGYYPEKVQEAFEKWFGIAEPEGFDAMRSSLAQGAAQISAVAGTTHPMSGESEYDPGAEGNVDLGADMTNLITRTGQMGGRAAKTFAEGYVAPLPGVLGNDHLVCTTLGIALSAQQHVMGYMRANVADLANKAVTAMRHSGPEQSSTDGAAVLLTVLGAVAGGIATVASGGTAAPIVAGLLATGAGAASGLIGATSEVPRKEVELGADHPKGVLSNIESGLEDLDDAVLDQEQKIQAILDDVEQATHDPGQFDMARPHLLDVRRANLVIKEDEIFINKRDLDKITNTWMPNIAGALVAARNGLVADSGPFSRHYAVGLGHSGPWSSYSALESRLGDVLTETAYELRKAAEHMEIAGQHIGHADDDANAALDRHSDQLDRALVRKQEAEAAQANRPPHMMPPGGLPLY